MRINHPVCVFFYFFFKMFQTVCKSIDNNRSVEGGLETTYHFGQISIVRTFLLTQSCIRRFDSYQFWMWNGPICAEIFVFRNLPKNNMRGTNLNLASLSVPCLYPQNAQVLSSASTNISGIEYRSLCSSIVYYLHCIIQRVACSCYQWWSRIYAIYF